MSDGTAPSDGTPTPPAEGSGRDLQSQFQQDPAKGVSMYSEQMARADRAEAELKKYEGAKPHLEKYGDKIAEVVNAYEAISGNQELVKGILHFNQHGKFPGAEPEKAQANDDSEIYMTDQEKALQNEVSSLKEQIDSLKGSLSSMTGSLGQDSLRRNISDVAKSMSLPAEVLERVSGELGKEFAQLEQNNPSQLQALIGPNGQTVIERAIKQHLTTDDFEKIVEHKRSTRTNALRSFETDGPSEIPTDGAAQIPDTKDMTVAEAFQWASENVGSITSR